MFDKIRENRKQFVDTDRLSYNRAANLAVNQTLMRSLNTSLIAVIPVVALMIGGVLSQATVLQDIALALFVGIAAGTVSSILLAAPLLVWIKERNPAVAAHTAKMQAKAKKEASRAGSGAEDAAGPARRAGRRARAGPGGRGHDQDRRPGARARLRAAAARRAAARQPASAAAEQQEEALNAAAFDPRPRFPCGTGGERVSVSAGLVVCCGD